jgi:hypothetical protein
MTSNNPTAHMNQVIDELLTQLQTMDATDPQYATVVDQLAKLTQMIPKKDPWVKPEVLIAAGTNLIGIFAILNAEKIHIIGSKALGFVGKTKLL